MKITEFRGKYRFLSNFYPSPIDFLGLTFPTVEHAYQAAKFTEPKDFEYIAGLRTPAEAKAYGKGKQPKDWHTRSLGVMNVLVWRKFLNHPDLKQQLLDTGDADLIEGNYWGDTFWGECPIGVGDNHLGRILEQVRKGIRDYESRSISDNAK